MWMGSQRKLVSLGELVAHVDREGLSCHRAGLVRRGGAGTYQAVQGQRIDHG